MVGAFVKLFRFQAVHPENEATAGVSTKPSDGTLAELELRKSSLAEPAATAHSGPCPAEA